MIFWIFLVSLFIALMIIFMCLSEGSWQLGAMVICVFIIFNFAIVPIVLEPHEHFVTDYNIPYCPESQMKEYQYQSGMFVDDKDLNDQFVNHGWTNITVTYITRGGFLFGGTDEIMTGYCDLK